MVARNAEREPLYEKDFFVSGEGNPKPNEGFAVPIEANGKVSVVRIELLPLDSRKMPILSLAEVQVFTRAGAGETTEVNWAAKPEWNDGKVHALASGDNSVVYLRR